MDGGPKGRDIQNRECTGLYDSLNVKASRNFASHLKEFRTWSVKPLEDHNYKFWKKYKEKLLEDSRDRVSRHI